MVAHFHVIYQKQETQYSVSLANIYLLMEENEMQGTEQSAGKKWTGLWVLLIISILANGYLIYDFVANSQRLRTENKELSKLADELGISKDSLQQKLNDLQADFDALYSESFINKNQKDSLQHHVDSLKNRVLVLMNRVRRSPDPRALLEANARLEALQKDYNNQQRYIDSVQKTSAEYKQELQNVKEKAQQDRDRMESEYASLESKTKNVNFSVLNFEVTPIQEKRREDAPTAKASRVDKLKIKFDIQGNDLISEGQREILVRIIGTNNEVLGANNNILAESSKLVSMSESFDYDGEDHQFNITYKQDEAWKKGQHTVELIHDGRVIDRVAFMLN